MCSLRRAFAFLSIWVALLTPAVCLAQRYTFQQYGQAEGLSNLNVNVLLQDRAGVLWAGTENGLNAFDARTERFQSYRVPELGRRLKRGVRCPIARQTLYG